MPQRTHTNRVSTTTHLPDGRILSGGGDGKLCIWPRAPQTRTNTLRPTPHPLSASSAAASVPTTTCLDLDGHASAVSKVAAVPESARLAFSVGYDGTVRFCLNHILMHLPFLRVWVSWERPLGRVAGQYTHIPPSSLTNRQVKLWDTQARRLLTCLDAGGPASSSGALDPVVDFAFGSAHLLSGARSGTLRLWDLASAALLW